MTDTNARKTAEIAEIAKSRLIIITVQWGGTIPTTLPSKGGKHAVAASEGGDESTISVSRKMWPKGYADIKPAADKARSDADQYVKAQTLVCASPGSDAQGANKGKGRVKQQRRWLDTRRADADNGRFFRDHESLAQYANGLGRQFAADLQGIINDIRINDVLGVDFDPDKYPDEDRVRAAYTHTPLIETVEVPSSSAHLPMNSQAMRDIGRVVDERLAAQYQFGMQHSTKQLAQYVGVMAQNLRALDEYMRNPDGAKDGGRQRRPAVYDSLFENARTAASTLREYAMPETDEGAQLIALLDEIDERLELPTITPEDVKNNHAVTANTAKAASELAAAIDNLDLFGGLG